MQAAIESIQALDCMFTPIVLILEQAAPAARRELPVSAPRVDPTSCSGSAPRSVLPTLRGASAVAALRDFGAPQSALHD
jgi:hypothetical protein